MTDDRLPTDLWVTATMRRCASQGIPFYVIRRGEYAGGTLMVKLVLRGGGVKLFTQTRDLDGNTAWMDIFDGTPVPDRDADDYIRDTVAHDPDLWVVEVETADGKNPFEGKVLA